MQVISLELLFFAKNSHLLANTLLVLNIGTVPKQAIFQALLRAIRKRGNKAANP